MKRTILGFALLVAGTLSTFAQWGRPVDYSAGPGLKDAYKDYFTIGVAVNQRNVSDCHHQETVQ